MLGPAAIGSGLKEKGRMYGGFRDERKWGLDQGQTQKPGGGPCNVSCDEQHAAEAWDIRQENHATQMAEKSCLGWWRGLGRRSWSWSWAHDPKCQPPYSDHSSMSPGCSLPQWGPAQTLVKSDTEQAVKAFSLLAQSMVYTG